MQRRAACCLPLLPLLPGCAARSTRREMALDPALFPRRPAEPAERIPGRLALQAEPAVGDQLHEAERGPTAALRIPIGRIVVQALWRAADDAFVGGVQTVDAEATVPCAARLRLQAVRVAYHQSLRWFLPIPIPYLGVLPLSDFEFDVHLAFDVSLIDAQGRVEWTHSYDDGRQVWPHEWTELGLAEKGLVRLTHEAAWRLAQRAVADLRAWVEADRLRPRSV